MRIFKSFMFALSLVLITGAAAQAQVTVQGVPTEYALGFQEPATPIMERAVAQYNILILPIMTAVTLFVLALLLWTCWKYREQEGRQPSTVTHNMTIEVIWTAVPILILVVTVVMRLVSVSTGRVLMSVATQKTIASHRSGADIFKFFDMGTKLVESETGFSVNEPVNYAVRAAIEAGVVEMVYEGERKGLWKFKGD